MSGVSKMAAQLIWDDNSWLLRVKASSGETLFTWTYPMFEEWTMSAIIPSEYAFMTCYIQNNITSDDLTAIYRGIYNHAHLCSRSVDAWYDLPEEEQSDWHDQTLYQLEDRRAQAQEREEAAMNWIVSDDEDFERDYACIAKDMCDLVRNLIRGYTEKRYLCERMLAEEATFCAYGRAQGADSSPKTKNGRICR